MAFAKDLAAGGISGSVAKTATAPIERVKLLIQTQDANPKILSGEMPRYTGIVNCFSRVASEQGVNSFWRGNVANVMRYFPTQVCPRRAHAPSDLKRRWVRRSFLCGGLRTSGVRVVMVGSGQWSRIIRTCRCGLCH